MRLTILPIVSTWLVEAAPWLAHQRGLLNWDLAQWGGSRATLGDHVIAVGFGMVFAGLFALPVVIGGASGILIVAIVGVASNSSVWTVPWLVLCATCGTATAGAAWLVAASVEPM